MPHMQGEVLWISATYLEVQPLGLSHFFKPNCIKTTTKKKHKGAYETPGHKTSSSLYPSSEDAIYYKVVFCNKP